MGNIKLIAFDLDDTLFNAKKEITPRTLSALERAASMGVELVPATGRFWHAVPENVKALKFVHYAITLNGAEIFDVREKKSLGKFEIDLRRAETMCRVFDDLPVLYDFVADGLGYMKREHYERLSEVTIGDWQKKIIQDLRKPVDDIIAAMKNFHGVQKMQIYTLDKTLRADLLKALPKVFPGILFTSSVPNNIEINDINANKGRALKFIADYVNIPIASTMAFGDGLNDTYMISAAGVGVAMGNACDELKDIADYVTASCNDDGIAEGISKFCF